MKKFLLCAFIICMRNISFAQSSIPLDSFYVPGTSWTEVATTTYGPCSAGNDVSTMGILYKIESDKIIAGKTYHMLSSCNLGSYGGYVDCNAGTYTDFTTGSGPCNSPVPFAMLRTDSNRVYFTLLTSQTGNTVNYDCDTPGQEVLFYDFNGYSLAYADSVMLSNGAYVPTFGPVIYGIGAQDGFIDYWSLYVCGPGPSASQYLLCYDNPHFNYQFSYPPGTLPGSLQYDCFNMDAYIDSVASVANTNANSNTNSNTSGTPALSIFPNPAVDQLNIIDTSAMNSITILNTLGQTVYSVQPTPAYYFSYAIDIDISGLAAGMYFVSINGGSPTKFVKIVQHK